MSLEVPYEFLDAFYFCEKKIIEILIGVALSMYIALGSINSLETLVLPIHEHVMSFPLFAFNFFSEMFCSFYFTSLFPA